MKRWAYKHWLLVLIGFLSTIGYSDSFSETFKYSPNIGEVWNPVERFSGTERFLGSSVYFRGQIWVVVDSVGSSSTGEIWHSPDGSHWRVEKNLPFGPRTGQSLVAFKDKMWLIAGIKKDQYKNDIWVSKDGLHWDLSVNDAPFSKRMGQVCLVHDDRIWIIGGQEETQVSKSDVWVSKDGKTWTPSIKKAPFSPRYFHSGTVFNNEMWVMGGWDGSYKNDVWHSGDGVVWHPVDIPPPFSGRIYPVFLADSKGLWLIGGRSLEGATKDVWYSENGNNWSPVSVQSAFLDYYGQIGLTAPRDNVPGLWIMGGRKSKLTDPAQTAGILEKKERIPPCGVWVSTNGTQWTETTQDTGFKTGSSSPLALVYEKKLWVINYNGAVWNSEDGISWNNIKPSGEFFLQPLVGGILKDQLCILASQMSKTYSQKYNGGEMLYYYTFHQIMFSNNGLNWGPSIIPTPTAEQPLNGREKWAGVIFKDKLWLVSGRDANTSSGEEHEKNDVWHTADGQAWTCDNPHAKFKPRHSPQLVVFQNKIWMFGGTSVVGGGESEQNDIWNSSDGIHWNKIKSIDWYNKREDRNVGVFDNQIWIISPYRDSNQPSEVWCSSNGLEWKEIEISKSFGNFALDSNTQSGFVPPLHYAITPFKGKVWFIGKDADDVWNTQ